MTVYEDLIQGSDAWLAIRKARPTASGFSRILTSTGSLSKSSRGYILELIGESFCPEFEYWGGNKHTEKGTQCEPEARACFSEMTGETVQQVGFVVSDDGISGCSPDGLLVDSSGVFKAGLELKCPSPKVHIEYVMDGVLPADYRQQVHGGMAITGLTEWHFFSYFPNMRPFHILVGWDDYTEKLKDSLAVFVAEYKATRDTLIPKLKI